MAKKRRKGARRGAATEEGQTLASVESTGVFRVVEPSGPRQVQPGTWRWLGDRHGHSEGDGESFHTAQNYARLAYLQADCSGRR